MPDWVLTVCIAVLLPTDPVVYCRYFEPSAHALEASQRPCEPKLPQRPNVLSACLFDEQLGQNDPFQAAMGLVYMSRLGLNW